VQSIASFALYGFPESHAASFALLAYASAYLKCHYLAAFTAALLNNQPMGFYHPSTLVKDAQRHGLRVLPVDVTRSQCCAPSRTSVSAGLNYVRGLRGGGRALLSQRRARRSHPSTIWPGGRPSSQRRDGHAAQWGVEYAGGLRPPRRLWASSRPFVRGTAAPKIEIGAEQSPLRAWTLSSASTRITAAPRHVGRHPLAWRREELRARASPRRRLARIRNGRPVRVAAA